MAINTDEAMKQAKTAYQDAYKWLNGIYGFKVDPMTAATLALAAIQRQNQLDDEELRRTGL